ncbi:MAG TPA: sialidase family protein [Candidatus Dormibacteraeota bacterium]
MRKSRLLGPALVTVAAAAVFGGSTGAAADSGFPRATANTDVAQNNKSSVRDMAIANVAVDPNDARHIAVVGGDWRLGTCNLYVSTDGGTTFSVGKRSPLPAQFDTCTPNGGTNAWGIAFDKSGNILVALMAANRPSTISISGSIVLAKTSDNGNTWQTTIVKDNRQTTPPQGAGQIQLAVDNARNRIYVGWQQRGVTVSGYSGTQRRAEVAVSTDGGASFGQPVDVEGDPASTLSVGGPSMSVGPDGTLWVFYSQSSAPKGSATVFSSQKPGLKVADSSDGGSTFTQAGTILATAPAFFGFPNLAAGAYKGGTALVLVYEAIAQGAAGSQYQLRDIWSQNSTDGGSTWSTPTRVTDDDIGTDLGNKFVPGIAAAPNGRFDAAWIDFRDDNGNLLSNTYYASSSDGGTTWSKNVKVSDAPSNRHYGQFANYSDVRSNVNIASNNYAANIVWDDSRQASPSADLQDIYFGAVQQAAIPESTSTTVLYIIAAVAGGLVAASLILVGAGLLIRRRRSGGRPTAAPPMAGTPTS